MLPSAFLDQMSNHFELFAILSPIYECLDPWTHKACSIEATNIFEDRAAPEVG